LRLGRNPPREPDRLGRLTVLDLDLDCLELQSEISRVGDKRRTRPLVIGILGQQMPTAHGEFARHGDRSDLVTTSGSNTQEERTQRAWRLGGSLGRFDRHGAGVAATALADVGCKGNY
jgi:hypothetical protein